MSPRHEPVPRPLRRSEYRLVFVTRQAAKGWSDLLATTRNAVVDAWEFLTATPTQETPTNHRLRAELATVTHGGRTYERWQHELPGGARLWFYVDADQVCLLDVHTHHPNQTKR